MKQHQKLGEKLLSKQPLQAKGKIINQTHRQKNPPLKQVSQRNNKRKEPKRTSAIKQSNTTIQERAIKRTIQETTTKRKAPLKQKQRSGHHRSPAGCAAKCFEGGEGLRYGFLSSSGVLWCFCSRTKPTHLSTPGLSAH